MSKILFRLRGAGAAGAGAGAGFLTSTAGAVFTDAGLFFNFSMANLCASVPTLAYAVKSHHWHERFNVPLSLCLAGISCPQQRQSTVPACVRFLVAIGYPFHLVNQVVK